MALFKHFKHLAAVGAVVCATSALAVSCSKDTSDNSSNNSTGDGGTSGNGAGSDLATGVAGKACTSASDCSGTGSKCATSLGIGAALGIGGTAAPDGYCTASCADDSECGDGVCIGALGALVKGQCLRTCAKDADCGRTGYSCTELDLQQIAATAADAGIGAGVDAGPLPTIPKACMPTPKTVQLADGIAGKACTADTACGAGTCSTMDLAGGVLPGGYCTGACLKDSECGSGAVCIGGIQTPFYTGAGFCAKTCTSNSDCRTPDYECPELPARAPAGTPRTCTVPQPDAGTPVATDAGGNTADAATSAADAGAGDAG